MNVILLAAPGAGKGTLSDLISSKYSLFHISTGDLLREELSKGSDLSNLIKDKMAKGELISNDIILELLKSNMKSDNGNYIFDGFPRNIDQAIMLDELLASRNMEIDYVIHITVNSEMLKKRIIGRVSCPNCKTIYNENFESQKPKLEGICDKCSSKLVHRSDDSAETFDFRYQTYLEETAPLIDYYSKLGKLVEVSNDSSKEETFDSIKRILEGEK